MLAVLDEPFRGTNVHDATEASLGVISRLVAHPGALVFVATHLAEVATALRDDPRVQFLCFSADLAGDRPVFDYRLRDGVSTQRLGMTRSCGGSPASSNSLSTAPSRTLTRTSARALPYRGPRHGFSLVACAIARHCLDSSGDEWWLLWKCRSLPPAGGGTAGVERAMVVSSTTSFTRTFPLPLATVVPRAPAATPVRAEGGGAAVGARQPRKERMNEAVDGLTRKVWPSVVQIMVTGYGARDELAAASQHVGHGSPPAVDGLEASSSIQGYIT
jgi:hypothetical protein